MHTARQRLLPSLSGGYDTPEMDDPYSNMDYPYKELAPRMQGSPEKRLGSQSHADLPTAIFAQELLVKGIPADSFNVHLEGANLKLWKKPDFITLLDAIDNYNFSRLFNDQIQIDEAFCLAVINGIARVCSEIELDGGAYGMERSENIHDWIDKLDSKPEELYFCCTIDCSNIFTRRLADFKSAPAENCELKMGSTRHVDFPAMLLPTDVLCQGIRADDFNDYFVGANLRLWTGSGFESLLEAIDQYNNSESGSEEILIDEVYCLEVRNGTAHCSSKLEVVKDYASHELRDREIREWLSERDTSDDKLYYCMTFHRDWRGSGNQGCLSAGILRNLVVVLLSAFGLALIAVMIHLIWDLMQLKSGY